MYEHTPMLRQFKQIKEQHQDCILFFRLGDFYEMFGDDAVIASKELDIVLTARDAGAGTKINMCGVPYHSAENYIATLISKGYKVAICEQTEDASLAKGIVKREVVRIITPGTLIEGKLLLDNQNNYLLSLYKSRSSVCGLSATDISTGNFFTTELESERELIDEIMKYNPSEIICSKKDEPYFTTIIESFNNRICLNQHFDYAFSYPYAQEKILNQLKLQSLTAIGLADYKSAVISAGAALDYLTYNHKTSLNNIFEIQYYQNHQQMILDYPTKKNLELFESNNMNKKNAHLLSVLDDTKTAMGGRKLKSWLSQPLTNRDMIQKRLNRTKSFLAQFDLSRSLRSLLDEIYDLERITAKITYETANAKDLMALKKSAAVMPEIKRFLLESNDPELKDVSNSIDDLSALFSLLKESISEDPPFTVREGGLIKDGYHNEIDDLRDISRNGKTWIAGLEKSEREKTGIKNLKIGFNKIFGYYFELTKSTIGQAPDYFIRKQTLANAERYITPELKEMEAKVIGADDAIKKLEYTVFTEIRNHIKESHMKTIMNTAESLAEIDVHLSFAGVAQKNNFTCPVLSEDQTIMIEALRHPVVEVNLEGQWYTPNNAYLDQHQNNFLIITGPNMGGKSTYCRSIAIAAILAQIGSFVPARHAVLPVFDRVFARIGANDDLSTGQSTFMVEMNEVSNIINQATDQSLIILDEVGRGTSTYDGLSLAWAITEYISQKIKAKTLFATHYHELTTLDDKYQNIKNLQVKVEEDGQDIIFLHEIGPGKADRSYGIQVAQLAGLPRTIIRQAKKILSDLEKDQNQYRQISIEQLMDDLTIQDDTSEADIDVDTYKRYSDLCNLIDQQDLNQTTPLEALALLSDIKDRLKKKEGW